MSKQLSCWLALCVWLCAACSDAARTEPGVGADSTALARNCHSNTDCHSDEWCAYTPGLCGKGRKPGLCAPKPSSCEPSYEPVCGCDGQVYESECQAHRAGADLNAYGGCKERVPDFVPCGPHYCDAYDHYCEIVLSDVFELPTDYTCRLLPAACELEERGERPCDCFPRSTACVSFCGDIETGGLPGFHLTCRL